jgi:hypothetical protein
VNFGPDGCTCSTTTCEGETTEESCPVGRPNCPIDRREPNTRNRKDVFKRRDSEDLAFQKVTGAGLRCLRPPPRCCRCSNHPCKTSNFSLSPTHPSTPDSRVHVGRGPQFPCAAGNLLSTTGMTNAFELLSISSSTYTTPRFTHIESRFRKNESGRDYCYPKRIFKLTPIYPSHILTRYFPASSRCHPFSIVTPSAPHELYQTPPTFSLSPPVPKPS